MGRKRAKPTRQSTGSQNINGWVVDGSPEYYANQALYHQQGSGSLGPDGLEVAAGANTGNSIGNDSYKALASYLGLPPKGNGDNFYRAIQQAGVKTVYSPDGKQAGFVDSQGNLIPGTVSAMSMDNDNAFLYGSLLAAGLVGGGVAAAGAGAAGAGGAAAGEAAAGAGGLSSAELAAIYGPTGYGAGMTGGAEAAAAGGATAVGGGAAGSSLGASGVLGSASNWIRGAGLALQAGGTLAGAIGASGAVSAAKDAAKNQKAIADQAAAMGMSELDFDKYVYNDQKAARDATQAAQLGLMQSQTKLSDQQAQIAADYDAYNKGTFRPLEQQLVSEAQAYDTPERRMQAVAESTADVEHSFQSANDSLNQALGRSGTLMSSGKALALQQQESLAKAGALAGASTNAVRNVETQGHARMMDAASLGRNLPSAQATAAAGATSAANSGVAAGTAGINTGMSGVPIVNQGYGGAMSGLSTAGSLYGQQANQQLAYANLYGQLAGQAATGLGKWMAYQPGG